MAQVHLPAKIIDTLGPERGTYQYRVLRGGRGSGKSVGAAVVALLWGYAERLNVLCVRQFQNSIADSFYKELVEALEQYPWLSAQYIVTKESITGRNGTRFIFKGLDRNPQSIKSVAKIDLTIVEEAEDIPEQSWINLEATVFRQPKAEMFILYNPRKENSPVDFRFVKNKAPMSIVTDVNFDDNPFFPEGLERLRQRDLEVFDYATYSHIWLGNYLKNSKAQIYHDKFSVKTFEPGPDWNGPYQGLDWGYSQDPTALIRAWVHDECLYIEYEAGDVGVELDTVPALMPCDDWDRFETRADSAQPAMISHVRNKGMKRLVGAKKGKGSVEDGIQFIRTFRHIYVHPRCKKTLNEFNTYSWKVDRLSGDILDVPVDANNHWCIAEGQLVMTDRGNVPIEQVTTDDKVMTRDGFNRVLAAEVTGLNKSIVEVKTTLGTLLCTADHPIYSGGLFIRADALCYGDEVIGDKNWQKSHTGMENHTADGLTQGKGLIGYISSALSKAASSICTVLYGNITTVRSLMDTTFITSMKIHQTMISAIWNALPSKNTRNVTLGMMSAGNGCSGISMQSGRSLKHGTQAKKVGRSIVALEDLPTKTLYQKENAAINADMNSYREKWETWTSFAATHVSQRGGAHLGLMTYPDSARAAETNSLSTSTQEHKPVVGYVLTVKEHGIARRVYNLKVEGKPEFITQGLLVHNCDALRYALEPITGRFKKSLTWV